MIAGSPCDASVGGHDDDGSHVTLQGSVKEGEALNVQHVHLVYEQHLQTHPKHDDDVTLAVGSHTAAYPRNNLGLPLLPPLCHLCIDLLPNLSLDLPCITCREGNYFTTTSAVVGMKR